MAVDLGDGVLGLEAVHRWQDGEWYALSIGDMAANPRFKLDRISGLHSLPEADDNRANRTGMIGEIAYPSDIHGKTVVYEGRVQAKTLKGLRDASQDLRLAFSGRNALGRMEVSPHASYGALQHFYGGRVLQLDMDDEQFTGAHNVWPYQRRFILGIRMLDPRFYEATLQSDSGNAYGATVESYQNHGTAPSEPVFTLQGPVYGNIIIERTSPDPRKLRFSAVPMGLIAGGDSVVVDFGARSVVASNGLILMAYFDFEESDWWDPQVDGLAPGAQNVRVQATGSGTWGIDYYHANW